VDQRSPARQLRQRPPLAQRVGRQPRQAQRVHQPAAQNGQRPHRQLDSGRLQALREIASLRQDRGRLPAALAKAARERRQLKVRAVQAGRRVQEEDPVRNRIRRAA
jgi:hypothetical protein